MIIRRIEPLSVAKVMATVYAGLGLIVGILVALIGMMGGGMFGGLGMGTAFGFAGIIVFPILYACIGFVATYIGAAIYNWAAGIVGGIVIQTD